MISSVGTFCTLNDCNSCLSALVAMPKPSFPSNSIEMERKSGGTAGLSLKRRQMAPVSAPASAVPIHDSKLAEVSFSTMLSGIVSSAAFLAAATFCSSSAAKAVAFFGALAPVP